MSTVIPLYELPIGLSEYDYVFYDKDKCLLELKEDSASEMNQYIINNSNTTWTYENEYKSFTSDNGNIMIQYKDDSIIKSVIKVMLIPEELIEKENLTERFFNFLAMLAISLRSDNKSNPYHFTFNLDEELKVLRVIIGQVRNNELIHGECGFKLEYLKELLQKITDEPTLYKVIKGLKKMLKDDLENYIKETL